MNEAGNKGPYQCQTVPARPEDIPQATHEGEEEYFGVKVRTYVLDDGRRIINAEDFHKLMAVLSLGRD